MADEETLTSNVFGTVTNRRVIYQRAKSWFRGGSREDIPLKHVTSVRLDITRHILGGLFLLILGLAFLAGPTVGKLIGVSLTVFGVLLLWGSPAVIVNTSGNDKRAAQGWPWERGCATAFVEAVREQLVSQ